MDKKDFIEQRKYARVPRECVVTFKELTMEQGKKEPMTTKSINISACGILFESKKHFPEGTLLKMELQLQRWEKFSPAFLKFDQTSISRPFVAIGKVTRAWQFNDNVYLLGVELENVSADHRIALERYLNHIMEEEKKKDKP